MQPRIFWMTGDEQFNWSVAARSALFAERESDNDAIRIPESSENPDFTRILNLCFGKFLRATSNDRASIVKFDPIPT